MFATALAQAPKNEIKLFVADAKVDEAKKRVQEEFPTGTPPPKKHQIYFFDTKSLELYGNTSGPVILRARQKEGKKPQSTVKVRRDKRDPDLEKKLADISSELEIETESIAGKKGPPGISYALDAKPGKELSELDNAGSDKIAGWFSDKQREFLEAAGVKVDWEKLKVFGRIEADVWEWQEQDKRVDAEVTAELWRLGTRQVFELSCKKPGGNAAQQLDSFVAFFKDHHILAVENPDSKTKQALDHFGSNTRPSPRPATTTTPAGP
ncbi:MAG TPA: hypothetical protein VGW39_09405 [Chthoniobacterales bacterium]|nr:hypothetical protein [Chthoniobacterales bacterium]